MVVNRPTADPKPDHSVADMARVALSAGGCNVLRAEHFSRRFPPHFHDTFAIGIVESGATVIRTQAGRWTARAGSLLAFGPWEFHGAEPAHAGGYAYRMIYPTTELVREIAPGHMAPRQFRAPVIEDTTVGALLARAHQPLMERDTSARTEDRLVDGLRALFARYGTSVAATGRPTDAAIIDTARAILRERLGQQVRLASLAGECGVNAFQLIRVFRRVVGMTPHAYLLQLRVNRAQALLTAGSRLSDVAYDCGFSDQSHLTRAFKSAVGVPPGQYARQVRDAA
jgi:AraC-like DNA-binding protein